MGYGWTHSYNIFLFNQRGHMFLMDGRGRVERYKVGPGGTFISGPGYFDKLVRTSSTTFTVTTKEKTISTFTLVPNTPFFVGGGAVYRLTSIVDRNNNVTTLTYVNGNLTIVTDTYGRSLVLDYNAQNKLVSVTDPLLRTTTLEYDSTGRQLLKITDPENHFIQYSYNLLYQLTGKVDKDGRVFSYLYQNREPVAIQDGAGADLFSLSNPQNWATNFNELALNIMRVYVPTTTSLTDGRGNVWRHDYESHGYITRVIAPDGATTRYSYDPVTLMVASKTNANNHITSFQYDALGNLTKMTDALGHITTYTYEPVFSQMRSMTDPNGRTTTYEYDSRGNRTREIDPLGQTNEWMYDSHGNVLIEKDKNNNLTQYDYDSFGNRRMITDALGNVSTFSYDDVGNLTFRTDANGHLTSYEYDRMDRLVRETDPLGKLTQRFYDGMGNRTKVIDRNANSTSYEYDLRQRLVNTTDALGQMTSNSYDGNNNRASVTDKNGHTTSYEYDVQNRLSMITDALDNKMVRTYDPASNLLTETDANNHTTVYEYDELNRRTKMTDAENEVARNEYDMAGLSGCSECNGPAIGSRLITKQTDGNGKVTYFKYDVLDRLILIIQKEGDTTDIIDTSDAVTRYTYDANSNRGTLTEPNGNTKTFAYDALDRLIKQTNAAGDVTAYTYDGVSNIVTRTDPNTNVTTNTYDALDRMIQVDDRLGRVASYTYDMENDRLSQTDGNGNMTRYEYDAIYRVKKITDPLTEMTTFAYDAVGNLLAVTDRNCNTTTYAYDAINRRISTTDALIHTTRYEYDGVGNLRKIIDAKPVPGITQYQYDGVNRLITETYPDPNPNTRTFSYDSVGNIKTRTDQEGQTTTYSYNDLYFLGKRDYPLSADDNMTYDLSGRMLTAERGGWLVTFAYDGANRVTKSNQNTKTVTYAYDIPGRTRTLSYPGGRSITERMDFRDRKTQINDAVSSPIVQYAYDLGNRVTSRAFRNGTVTNYTYNPNDWVLSLEHFSGASRIVGFGYAYDKEGNKKLEDKRHDTSRSEAYKYDSVYRLIDYRVGPLVGSTVPVPVTQTTYDLDPVSNWNSKTTNSVTETRTHNAVNEITSIDGVPIVHDDNGNLRDDQFFTYDYDEENRLTQVTRKIDNEVVGLYQYDALGRRVLKLASPAGTPTETRYFYDGWRVLEEQSATSVTQATYVYGNYIDEVLTRDRGGQTLYYHQNTQFSTYALTNATGDMVEAYQYDAYGRATVFTGPGSDGVWFTGDESQGMFSAFGNPYMYTGQRFDVESGLYYFKNRYYQSDFGRFLTRDQLDYLAGPNLYAGYFVPRSQDPFGFDVYVENTAEIGGWHRRICVDTWDDCCKKKTGKYCIAYGLDGLPANQVGIDGTPGEAIVYSDDDPATKEVSRLSLRCDQDRAILTWFKRQVGKRGPYSLCGYTCRTYASDLFDYTSSTLSKLSDPIPKDCNKPLKTISGGGTCSDDEEKEKEKREKKQREREARDRQRVLERTEPSRPFWQANNLNSTINLSGGTVHR